MIPKIIHFCWFGGNEKPELVLKCIESWKKFAPDYEIREWNENNWNVNFNDYTKEAYELKKWAFVSDVARMDIVYRYGGIYLDTDVELVKPLDDLLNYDGFFAFEEFLYVNSGLGFGSCAGNKLIKQILDDYNSIHFCDEQKNMISPTCLVLNTGSIKKVFPALSAASENQIIDNVLFMSSKCYSLYAVHHYAGTWTETPKKKDSNFVWKIKKFLRNPNFYKKLEKHPKLSKLYIFLVYDLIEIGPLYYLKKIFSSFFGKKGS